jgi:general secretion pathway protein E
MKMEHDIDIARVVAQAMRVAPADGRRRIEVMEERLALAPADFVAGLAELAGVESFGMARLLQGKPAFDHLGFGDCLRLECVILELADGRVYLVVADPFDGALQDRVGNLMPVPPRLAVAHRADIVAYLHRYEESSRAMDSITQAADNSELDEGITDISLRTISNDTSPVVRLVNSTLHDAFKAGASDIHLESGPAGGIVLRHRVDGVLVAVGSLGGMALAEQVISRIKVMAELDIAERRVPQDGRFRVAYGGREIDLRVSIMPSIHGEDAVLRILDRRVLSDELSALTLDGLGFDAATIDSLRRLARRPYGMLLVTGPTGSGKTTTLYAALGEINHGDDKIVTIEDPVEYQLKGVLQIPVNEKKGLTFARGLRSILRHDPDKIMVGEIRDGETAQIAVQSALTGHLVFTTVHANSVFDVLGRFAHMGVELYSLVAALNGIVAQRLLRINCPACSEPAEPSAEQLRLAGVESTQGWQYRAGRGCGECRGSGYKGRKAVAELLLLDDNLREMIVGRESVRRLKEVARAGGTRLLRETALDLVRDGETTLEELNRVVA